MTSHSTNLRLVVVNQLGGLEQRLRGVEIYLLRGIKRRTARNFSPFDLKLL